MITFWLQMFRLQSDLYYKQRVAFHSMWTDRNSYVSWRPVEIDGVPMIGGC